MQDYFKVMRVAAGDLEAYPVFHNGLSIVITFSLSLTLSLDDKKVLDDFGEMTLKVLSPCFAIKAPSAVAGKFLTNFQFGP